MLAKPANASDLIHFMPAQCNTAAVVGAPCSFQVYSMIAPMTDPQSGGHPDVQVSWTILSGPNVGRHGKCTRNLNQYNVPTGVWSASYLNQGTITPTSFQDVIFVFLDYDSDEIFDDMAHNHGTDPNDPAAGVTIEYGATFTVNWGLPFLSVVKLPTPAAAAEPATSASFRVSRSGSTAGALSFTACLGGSATPNCTPPMPFDYVISVNGVIIPVNSDRTFTATIPAGSPSVDIAVIPVDDTLVEGPETVRIALKDSATGSYVVNGNGFAQLTINDNDQPVVTATKSSDASEGTLSPGLWLIQTSDPLNSDLKVYFKLSGTADNEVDYFTDLVPVTDDSVAGDKVIFPSGTCRLVLHPNSGPGGIGLNGVTLTPFQDSRTEGTESATLSLITNISYKCGSPASASINIADDDSPKLPANGYTITDLGDANHVNTFAMSINNHGPPQVAGSGAAPIQSAPQHSFRWENGTFTDIPPLPGTVNPYIMLANAVGESGIVVGTGFENGGPLPFYYWIWDGSSTIQLPTPTTGVDLDFGPHAINDANWIVGAANNIFGAYKATVWDPSIPSFVHIGSLSVAQDFSAFAWGISPSATGHRVVGESQIDLTGVNGATTTAFHGFRTQPDSTIPGSPQLIAATTDQLGNAIVSETSSSGAYAINNLAEVAGYSASSATEMRAAYKDGNSRKHLGWRVLGVLGGGSGSGLSSQALGMNDVGLIVGWSRTTTTGDGAPKAVVWENYQGPAATDLNSKIPVGDRSNWLLQRATGINTSGQIVGYGLKNGVQRAFLLTPIP